MGDDIPLVVLSHRSHRLHDHQQRFAQSPTTDRPLREKLVMSLEMTRERTPALKPQPEAAAVIHLDTPVLNEAELAAIGQQGLPVETLSTQVTVEACAGGLQGALDALCSAAQQAVSAGAQVLVLSDRVDASGKAAPLTATSVAMPALLAVGAVHHHLLRQKLRLQCSLVVDTAQCWSTHHVACLTGYGASAVCPWLTWETTRHWLAHPKTQKRIEQGKLRLSMPTGCRPTSACRLKTACARSSPRSASPCWPATTALRSLKPSVSVPMIALAFSGTTSRVAGMTLVELARETLSLHAKAFPELNAASSNSWASCSTARVVNTTSTVRTWPRPCMPR